MSAIGAGTEARPRLGPGAGWHASPYSYATARALSQELGLSFVTASVLVRRGFRDADSVRRFLEASETHDPLEFQGMENAVELILDHVRRGSVIAVHGDYDVDGVCSTALAVSSLRALGVAAKAKLPSRTEDGYGLSVGAIDSLRSQGTELLITADCGIGAVDEVAHARRLGMDVVVTDHHRPGDELPGCAVVHPAVCGYPCPDLCATGVVYKLCQGLFGAAGRDLAELERELDIVALATVADVVSLLGENRTLVREGIRVLAAAARPGLRALMTVSGVDPQSLTERALGFALAPRINAAGRLQRADAGLELLLTDDHGRALEIARELDAVNTERRSVETRILFEAEQQLSSSPFREDPLYVLAAEEWHPGVIGIVASRLVERYHRPCVLVSIDGSGAGRGSGRSIGPYDLHAGLAACSHHLIRFGGHRMAAGLEMDTARLAEFRAELVEHARAALEPEDLLRTEHVDAVVAGDAVGLDLAEELERLRPFGMGNPGVRLLLPAARVSDIRPMAEGRHARFTVTSGGVRSRAVAFGAGVKLAAGLPVTAGSNENCENGLEPSHDLVARLEVNEWRGAVEPRLVLSSLHPVDDAGAQPLSEDAQGGCADCACRARGVAWWDAVWRGFDKPADAPVQPQDGRSRSRSRTVVDCRGQGIVGSLSDLLSTGEPVLAVCMDVSRRRTVLRWRLDPVRFGRSPALVVSARCAHPGQFEQGEDAFCLADYATIETIPALAEGFTHVFLLDPPPFERLSLLLRHAAPARQEEGFLHLGWGAAEVEFTRKAIEHDYGLRAPLAAIYRALAGHPDGVEDGELESILAGESSHPLQPALVGRCLRVLVDLGLAELERSGATVKCTITARDRVDLERSSAFQACASLYREAMAFLSEPTQQTTQRRAA